MEIPGGPGVIGAILAGSGISITSDGTMSINPAQAITQIRAGSGISISPASGIGEVTVSSNAVPRETIPPGSRTIFRESSAPTGWTLATGFDNRTIRIVNNNGGGSGGQRSFTDVFTSHGISGSFGDINIPLSSANSSNASLTPSGSISGSMSLSATSITADTLGFHTHQYADWIRGTLTVLGEQNPIGVFGGLLYPEFFDAMNSGAHTHSGSVGASFSGNAADHAHSTSGNFTCNTSFSGNDVNLSVQYVDVILCTKN
jgi:hypothetical protein